MQPTLSVAVPTLRTGREIVLLAEHESRDSGFGFLDAEHLLVAAVVLCGGTPRLATVFDRFGVSADRVRGAVRAFVGAGTVPYPVEDDRVVCTPAGARVLARAEQIAGPAQRVRPHHVVLAVLDGIDDPFMGGAHELLESVDVDVRRFRRALARATRRV